MSVSPESPPPHAGAARADRPWGDDLHRPLVVGRLPAVFLTLQILHGRSHKLGPLLKLSLFRGRLGHEGIPPCHHPAKWYKVILIPEVDPFPLPTHAHLGAAW